MSKSRAIFFRLLTLGAFLGIVFHAWYPPVEETKAVVKTRTVSVDEFLIGVQAKYLIGFRGLLDSFAQNLPANIPRDVIDREKVQFETLIHQIADSPLSELAKRPMDQPTQDVLYRKRAVFFSYLGYREFADKALEKVDGAAPLNSELKQLLTTAPVGEGSEALRTDLGSFFAKLLKVQSMSGETRQSYELAEIVQPATESAVRLFVSFLVFLLLLGLALILFLIMFFKVVRRSLRSQLQAPEIHPAYLLEIFAIYLLMMSGLSWSIGFIHDEFPELLAQLGSQGVFILNILGILLTLLAVVWPMFWGNSFRAIRHTIGLSTKGFGSIIGNVFRGFGSYLAAWIPALPILMVYSLVLQILKIDPSGAAHPVVPILFSEKGGDTFVPIFILAVGIAPIVEEIMFRGALYTYLRETIGRSSAVVFSALIFAMVHPQGPIGVLPLTMIGIMLALLREWRGSLVAPMIAHACVNAGTLYMVSTLLS